PRRSAHSGVRAPPPPRAGSAPRRHSAGRDGAEADRGARARSSCSEILTTPIMRRHRSLTYRGAGALLAGVVCVIAANILAAPILLYVAMLLFLLVILAALVVHGPRRTGTVTRRISTDLLTVGEDSEVAVRFDLRSLRLPHGMWRDELPSAVSGDAAG